MGWRYVYYVVELLEKDENDYDGTQQYVWDLLQEETPNISWVPQAKAMVLDQAPEEDDSSGALSKISAMLERQEGMLNNLAKDVEANKLALTKLSGGNLSSDFDVQVI